MPWVCSVCSSNNPDSAAQCEVCGDPKPATVEPPKSTSVCTLTQTRAKEKCNYADVTVPEEYNVIGENAFKGRTDLYTIRIHSGIRKIMRGAFDGCTNLYGVYVEGELSSIGARAFADCKYLSPERRPTADTVAKDAFVGCSDSPMGIPDRTVGAKPKSRTTNRPTTGTRTGSGSSLGKATTGSKAEFTKTGSTVTPTPSRTASTPPKTTSSYTPPKPPPPKAKTTAGASISYSKPIFDSVYNMFPLCFLIAVLAFIGVFLFTDWGLYATAEAWQIAGGIATVFCIGMFTHYLYYMEKYVEIGKVLSVLTALSFVVWLFEGKDTPIALVIAVGSAVLSFVYSYLAFDNVETECGWWLVGLGTVNLVNVVFLLVRFNYFVNSAVWQVLVAEIVTLLVCVWIHNEIDMEGYEFTIPIAFVGFLITCCASWWFGGYFSHFTSVLSLGLIVAGIVCAVKSFENDEVGAGVTHIVVALLQIGSFAVCHLVYA